MFERGVTYKYAGCTGAFPVFTFDWHDGEGTEYLQSDAVLCDGDGSVNFIAGVWEPVYGAACLCLSTDPLVFECEHYSPLIISDREENVRNIIRGGMYRLGCKSLSDNDLSDLYGYYDWYIENTQYVNDEDKFVNFVVHRLNEEYLLSYNGSYNGAIPHQKECHTIFDLLFGYEDRRIIMRMIDMNVPMQAELVNGVVVLKVDGRPYDEYVADVMGIPRNAGTGEYRRKISSLLESASG